MSECISCSCRPMTGSCRPMTGSCRPLTGSCRPMSGSCRPVTGSCRPVTGSCRPVTGSCSVVITVNNRLFSSSAHSFVRKKHWRWSALYACVTIFDITVQSSSVPYQTKICRFRCDWCECVCWVVFCRLSVLGNVD